MGVISRCLPPFEPSKKSFLDPSVSIKSLLICFDNCPVILYSHRQSRKRVVNILLMVNITPISFEDNSMLGPSKIGLPHPF